MLSTLCDRLTTLKMSRPAERAKQDDSSEARILAAGPFARPLLALDDLHAHTCCRSAAADPRHVVWQQDRSASDPIGSRIGFGDAFRAIAQPGTNVFVIKTSFWLPVK
jgi:hypothetical protein